MKTKPIYCTPAAEVTVNGGPAKYTRDGNYVVVEIEDFDDEVLCVEPSGFTVAVCRDRKTIYDVECTKSCRMRRHARKTDGIVCSHMQKDIQENPDLWEMAQRELALEECIAKFIIASKAFMKRQPDSLGQLRDCITEGQQLLENGGQ